MQLVKQGLPANADDCLRRARDGDLDAFDAIFVANEKAVFSIAMRFMGRRADAQELTQDVFMQLHAALGQIVDQRHLRHWLLRTVTHRCLDRRRNDGRRPQLVPIETLEPDAQPAAPETEADPMARARLRQLLLGLPLEARAVVLLRYQEDLDPPEIASLLEMPVNTVKSHLRRSLEWLRAQCTGDNHGY